MYNITNQLTIEQNYQNGLLPQRNQSHLFYQDSSSRSNLSQFQLSSENRRILRKTEGFSFQIIPLSDFDLNHQIQKQIHDWVKQLGWKFPTNSIKTVFSNHIFNHLYIWQNSEKEVVAFSICYFSDNIAHIGYVFYNPQYSHSDLPVRLVLQFVIDCHQKKLTHAYLGRFSDTVGFYKRNMPGFEYYQNGAWIKYQKT